jgi:hypothetical protein
MSNRSDSSDTPAERPVPNYPVQYQPNGFSPYNAPIAYQPVYPVYLAQPKGFSVTALVLGLVSIVFGFTLLVPLSALIFGIVGLKREPAGRGMAIVGIVIGGLFMLFWLAFGGAILALIVGVMSAAVSVSG